MNELGVIADVGIFQRIRGTVEKRDSGFLKWIRMGGIRRLKENCL